MGLLTLAQHMGNADVGLGNQLFESDAARRATQTKVGIRIILEQTIEIITSVKNNRRTSNC